MFLKMNMRHQAHKPVKKCKYLGRFSKRNGQERQGAIGPTVAEITAIFLFFEDGGRPPSWICYVCVRTTHKGHLVVFIAVQNLVGIDAVVLIICMFFDFASLA